MPAADMPRCAASQCDHADYIGHKWRRAHYHI